MPQTAEEILEFPQVLGLVRRHITSPLGLAEVEKLEPLEDRSAAIAALAETAEAMEYLATSERQAAPVSFSRAIQPSRYSATVIRDGST